MHFTNALRECLGMQPLYRRKNEDPPSYGACFDDGNRRTGIPCSPDNVNHQKRNSRERGDRAARRILGFGR